MPAYRSTFISHAHADNDRCASIAAHLRARGVNVWIDLANMQRVHSLPEEITRELVRRQEFVLMMTPISDVSRWVGNELDTYLSFSLNQATSSVDGQQRMILPVMLEPTGIHPDAEVNNLAKVFGRTWIDGVGKSDEQVADEIAAAIAIIPDEDQPDRRDPPRNEREEIGIAESLYRLGYRGWRMRRTGVEFLEPPICHVAAGMFVMGSAESDQEAYDTEKPQYRIPVAAFSIAKFPLMVAEYSYYVKANPGQQDLLPSSYTFPEDARWCAPEWRGKELNWQAQQTRPDHPVVNITWFQATAYAAWLAQTTGQPWSLPTEAEWEKAARWDEAKQVSRIYPWGDTFDPGRCNTRNEDGSMRLGRTSAVGSYPSGASPCGAQDMAGNVWEWCSSLYKEHYPYDPSASEDDGKNRTDVRVLRGGSWGGGPRLARAAYRGRLNPAIWNYVRGARVCLRATGT